MDEFERIFEEKLKKANDPELTQAFVEYVKGVSKMFDNSTAILSKLIEENKRLRDEIHKHNVIKGPDNFHKMADRIVVVFRKKRGDKPEN